MEFHYDIKNKRLKKLVENKSNELQTSVDDLIWSYINRGLVDDSFNEDIFKKLHSKKYLSKIEEVLGFD